jgi:ABC-type sulfate transport system permease component
MEYGKAHIYAAIMLGLSFVVLLSVYVFNHREKQKARML